MWKETDSLKFSIFLPLAMLFIVGTGAMFWISKTANSSHEHAEAHQQKVTKALEVVISTDAALVAFDSYVKDVTSFNQIIAPDEVARSYKLLSTDVLTHIHDLSNQAEMGVDSDLLSRLEIDALAWVSDAKVTLGLQASRQIPTMGSLDRRRAQIQATMSQVYDLAREYEERSVAENRAQFQDQMAAAQISLVLLLIAGGVIAFYRANYLASVLQRLSLDMSRIRKGQFNFEVNGVERRDEIGDMARNVASFSDDLQELTATKEHVEYLALHDPLTGLRNRRCMDRRLEELGASDQSDIVALHIDLDRFKVTNDTHGHQAGDAILKHVADALSQTVCEDDLIFRVGGDEFLILSRTNATEERAADLAQAIIRAVSVPLLYLGNELDVSASVGIAFFSQSNHDPDLLLSNADLALYDAKAAGRGRFEFSSKARRIQRERRRILLEELKCGIARDELILFFQPQVDTSNNTIVGVEALLRWDHPQRGILSPIHFLELAMESGLGDQITKICIEQAIDALKTWRSLDLGVPSVSINLAASQLHDASLVEDLHDRVRASGLCPSDIAIEIVESVLFGDQESLAVSQVRRLRELGYRIELDDFGTGHASISNLTRLKVDKIKIDRTFVSGVDEHEEKRTIVAALVDLSKNLRIECLAEGIESDAERDTLIALGCYQFQGYAIARPQAMRETTEWLIHQNTPDSSLKSTAV